MQRLIDLLTRFDAASPVSVLNETGRWTGRRRRWKRSSGRRWLPSAHGRRVRRVGGPARRPVRGAAGAGNAGGADAGGGRRSAGARRRRARRAVAASHRAWPAGDAADARRHRQGVHCRRHLRGTRPPGRAAVSRECRRGHPHARPEFTRAGVDDCRGEPVAEGRLSRRRLPHRCGGGHLGNYERSFDEARRYHHIVNAASGRSPVHCSSVTVVAPTALAADALATSAFVMGPRGGIALIEALPGCACLILDHEGREHRSRTWRSATPLNGGSETS